jgi:hypothetical protein
VNSGGSTEQIAREQETAERERQARIRLGQERIADTFREFDEPFFNRLRQASLDINVPDLNQQFQRAREQLSFTLARQGTLRGTAAARRNADLVSERSKALTQADSLAEQSVRQARQDIENERSGLVGELMATADPEATANAANARAGFLRSTTADNNIGTLFQNATAGLAAVLRPRYDQNGLPVGRGFSFRPQGSRARVVG